MNPIDINEKSIVKQLLIENNIPTAPFYMWNPDLSDDENLAHITLKRPLVVKPDFGEKGLQVSTNIIDDATIIKKVNEIGRPVLIEEQIQGYKEYRVTVLNDAVIGATEKITASVTGDGTHTVLELIDAYNQSLNMYKIHTVDYDYIQQQGYQKHDVLPTGFHLTLTNVANMSNGSQIKEVDITTIHPINIMLFTHINRILKYTLSGIDYLGDLAVPYTLMGSVIEVNSNPGIDIHYTVVKHKKAFLTSIVDNLFNFIRN
jgi:D-alanine-D-alanine ligase-like ATP-grasp enzyme